MKIVLLLCSNLEKAQYLYKYVKILDSMNCDYDIIYWNRNLSSYNIKCTGNLVSFDKKIDSFKPLFLKIYKYFSFIIFIHKIIKENKYDKIIFLTTPSIICAADLCFGKYKKKYIFDFRDLTKEYIFLYKKIVQKLIYNSEIFITSSYGYLKKLGVKKGILCHNSYGKISYKGVLKLNKKDKLKVVYWGVVRQLEYNKKICELFGKDNRFEFIFHGEGKYKELRKFCENKNIKNIFFTGPYKLNQLKDFSKETDILFNAYNKDFVTTPSLAVKIYDSLEYQIPMIVSKGTYMEEYLKEYKHIFIFTLEDEKILDKLFEWYVNLKVNELVNDFEKLRLKINKDEIIFKNALKRFINDF